MPVQVNFLAHTRSIYFDYAWVHGLNDQALEDQVGRFALAWLGNELLDRLPPVTVFFLFQNHCVLLVARRSENRVDRANRPIFERALLLWNVKEGLRYSHLVPLLELLEETAHEVFNSLPDDVLKPPRTVTPLDFQMKELDQRARDLKESTWDLPLNLTLNEAARAGLTVEVPSPWSFAKMGAPLGDAVIDASRPFAIGQSLTFRNRIESQGAWILHSESDLVELPRLRDASGAFVGMESANSLRSHWANEDSSQSRPSEKNEQSEEQARQQAPVEVFEASDLQEAAQLSQSIASSQRGSKGWALSRKSAESIPDAIKRLQLLTASLGRLVGPDILMSWQYLLMEISVFHSASSAGVIDEWMRRLNVLYRFATHRAHEYPQDWRTQIEHAYNLLYKTLDDLRYR